MANTLTQDRESWLGAAIEIFRPRFNDIKHPLPETIRVAVGFGPTGARQENSVILGVTLIKEVSVDDVNEVWISPEDADTASMLATLIHELCHVADNCESGHRGDFAEMAKALGLTGPMTATRPGIELAAELITIAAALGQYPGAAVDFSRVMPKVPAGSPAPVPPIGSRPRRPRVSSGPAPQGTRMLVRRCEDSECVAFGYTVRLTQKWIDLGAPKCPMGHDMH